MLTLGRHYQPLDLLPQRPPMLLLDAIDDYGEDWLHARINIHAGSFFFDPPNGVPGYVGLEYMAQAALAHGGIEIAQRSERPQIALLIGCREYVCSRAHFAAGVALIVEAQLILRDAADFTAYDCRIHCEGELLARSILKAVRPKDLAYVIQSQSHD